MTPEQFTAILVALGGLVGAVAALLVAVHNLHDAVDGRLQQLLDAAVESAAKDGELRGRDFMRRLLAPPTEPPDTENHSAE